MKAHLLQANALNIPLASDSVQMVVTSPPYWSLRDYGVSGQLGLEPLHDCAGWATGDNCGACFVCHMRAVFAEVKRVLREDGTCWVNLGDSYNGSGGAGGDYNPGGLKDGQPKYPGHRGAGLKPKDLVGIPWRVAMALQADGWYLRSDIIWCLSHSTRVYAQTQKGEMPMTVGEMVRLKPETVKLWTGNEWAQVRGFSQSQETTEIEIELRSGQRISCTPGHLWPTERGELRADQLMLGDKLLRVNLPEPKHPTCPGGIPDRFGWVMGFYLAEGSALKGDGLQFAMNAYEDIEAERLRSFAEYYGSSFTVFDYGNSRHAHILGGAAGAVIREYISGADCKHKHLTTAAWQRSNEFLSSLLHGYLAGDGHFDKDNNRWRLGFARNDAMADDLRTIGARLGVSVRLKRTWHKNQTGKFYGWRGEIRFGAERRTSDTEIVGLQKSKSERFFDIGIDEPHVFALSCGVLTHNSKPNPMPESVTDRPTKSHEYLFLLSKQGRYYYDAKSIEEPAKEWTGQAATFERSSGKATELVAPGQSHPSHRDNRTPKEWTFGKEKRRQRVGATGGAISGGTGETVSHGTTRNKRTVWNIATYPYSGAHFATYPPALITPCIKAGSRPGDIVLDPFNGSGTTGLVCQQLGRRYVGMDLSPDYLRLSRERMGHTAWDEWTNGRQAQPADLGPLFAAYDGER